MPKKKEKSQTKSKDFSTKVREVVKAIPVGETKSYQEVAELAGR